MKIERVSRFRSRWSVEGGATWEARGLGELLVAESGGHRYEFRPDGRNRFVLLEDGLETLSAVHGGGSWEVTADGVSYELRPQSRWRHSFDVLFEGRPIGAVRRARGSVVCDLPPTVPRPVQTFIGLLALSLWKRTAVISSAAAGSVASQGS